MASSTATGLKLSAASPVVLDEPRDAMVGVNVRLHPLPIISMSEHLTRTAMQTGSMSVKVVGALLGTQTGRDIEVHTTFEVLLAEDGTKVDREFLESRQRQFKQVFPSFDFLGWYANGTFPTESDMAIHKQFFEYNESPLFLQLSPSASSMSRARSAGELPIGFYETFIEVAQAAASSSTGAAHDSTKTSSGPSIYFRPARYTIETGEAERIAVDHTSKPIEQDGDDRASTGLIASLTTQYNAVKMLSDRISTIAAYVEAVQSGTVERDHESLRQIASLMAGLPASGDLAEFEQEFLTEYNDLLLTNYLSNLTGSLNTLNELVDKFDAVQSNNDDATVFGGGAAGASRFKGGRGAGRGARMGMV